MIDTLPAVDEGRRRAQEIRAAAVEILLQAAVVEQTASQARASALAERLACAAAEIHRQAREIARLVGA